MTNPTSLTICIPFYNERDGLDELVSRIDRMASTLPDVSITTIFVDDGSTDQSAQQLAKQRPQYFQATIIALSRNFGHQAAIHAALSHADGDYVCIMDADLQDEPEHIPAMLASCRGGYDVTYAIRETRDGNPLLILCYRAFYHLLHKIADVSIPMHAGDFCIMSRKVATTILQLTEYHRYNRGLRAWIGFQQTGYPVHRPARHAGTTKYTLSRLCSLALVGICSFTKRPLQISTYTGIAALACSILFALYAVIVKILTNSSPTGFTALLITIIFMGGIQLLSLGMIGNYIGFIFEEVKKRPLFVIDTVTKLK
jgi:dolichol-phosphate mannosyltransferase